MDKKKFHKDMTVGQVVDEFPGAADILMGYGLHCVGCFANSFETVEQGVKGHGYNDEDLEELIEHLNEAYEDESLQGTVQKVAPKEAQNMTIKLTDRAVEQIKMISEKEDKAGWPLRIHAEKAGKKLKYAMNFTQPQETTPSDKGFQFLAGKVRIVVDTQLYHQMNGLEVDYVKEENRAGFKMNNPNVES